MIATLTLANSLDCHADSANLLAKTGYFFTRFCDSQNLGKIHKVDCHTNPLDLLAMTKYYNFAFDLQSIRVSVIAIEVIAVDVLCL